MIEDTPQTRHDLEWLGRMLARTHELADWFGCSPRTVQRFLRRYPGARATLEAGRAVANPNPVRLGMVSRRAADMIVAAEILARGGQKPL